MPILKKTLPYILAALFVGASYGITAELNNLSPVDANNTFSAANAGFPENMPPSAVNNASRALEGMLARYLADSASTLTVSSTSDTAYAATANQTITSLHDGMVFLVELSPANAISPTLNISNTGAISLIHEPGATLGVTAFQAGQRALVSYDSTNNAWQIIGGVKSPSAGGGGLQAANNLSDVNDANASRVNLGINGSNEVIGLGDLSAAAQVTGLHEIWLPAGSWYPTISNGAQAVAVTENTNGRPNHRSMQFDPSSDEAAQMDIAMPSNWDEGTLRFQIYATQGSNGTGSISVGVQCVALADDDSFDTAYGSIVLHHATAKGTPNDLMVSDVPAAASDVTIAGSPSTSEATFCRIFRDVSDAGDDLAEDAYLIGAKMYYRLDESNASGQ